MHVFTLSIAQYYHRCGALRHANAALVWHHFSFSVELPITPFFGLPNPFYTLPWHLMNLPRHWSKVAYIATHEGCGLYIRPLNDYKYCEGSFNQTKANLPVGLRCCNCWKNFTTVPLQALPFLSDAKVYPVVQAVGTVETTQKSKLSV